MKNPNTVLQLWAIGTAVLLAGCAGEKLTDPIGSSNPVNTVVINPSSASVGLNGTVQLSAVLTDSLGMQLSGRQLTWSTDAEAVATVSATGVVRGASTGSTTIRVESEGRSASAAVTVTEDQGGSGSGPHAGYHVSPSGTSGGDGSADRPWDLATALSGAGGRVQPGDTVWLRTGTYRGVYRASVSGAAGKPVVFRQYPNERATLDGRLRLDGPDLVVWGFEIMRSSQSTTEYPNLEARGPRQKLINMVVHESEHQGIRFWDEAVDAEMYGCIVYNNGTHENLDHGTYVHNVSGTKLIMDNVFFNNLAYGIHVYVSPGEGAQRNVHVIGNVVFNNGTISTKYAAKGNILIGGEQPGQGHQAIDNLLYFSGTSGVNMRLGYVSENKDVIATGNTIWGGATAFMIGKWSSANVMNNTIGGSADMVNLSDTPAGYSWSGNKYYRAASATAWRAVAGTALTLDAWKQTTGLGSSDAAVGTTPAATQVFVRANKYEQGRGLVVVYNWGKDGSVRADLSSVLRNGQRYEVRNVQDLFGAAVASGTYSGDSITLPMTGVNAPPRIGRSTPTPPRTGPNFDTFVVIPL
ncbi:MAG TPA: Ig-like domain-containing protein [Gemmatimonadales bacterium]|nr:Ig-like domain-containing protein [Gemmatimonadales bacterium]